MHHFIEGWRDQTTEPNGINLMLFRFLQDCGAGNHHTEVDHLVVVTLEHNPHDIFPDVVHITFDGGHEDLAGGLTFLSGRFLLKVRFQVGHGLFHDPGTFHDLWQEHLS